MTASTIDFPLQSRALELVDEGNGYLSIYVTNFDHNSEDTTLAGKARQLAAGRKVFVSNIEGLGIPIARHKAIGKETSQEC